MKSGNTRGRQGNISHRGLKRGGRGKGGGRQRSCGDKCVPKCNLGTRELPNFMELLFVRDTRTNLRHLQTRMALVLRKKDGTFATKCALCGETLSEPIFSTSQFRADDLQRYADASMHWDCYAAWDHHRALQGYISRPDVATLTTMRTGRSFGSQMTHL